MFTLNRLKSLLSTAGSRSTETSEKVANHWSKTVSEQSFSSDVYWLANPLVQRNYQDLVVRERPYDHWLNLCVGHYLGDRCPVDNILSVGCGSGGLERHLALLKAFKHIDAVDISPESIRVAKEQAEAEGIGGINYQVQNVEQGFPRNDYDVIIYNSSLHHMMDMDKAVRQTALSMKKDGFLFLNEYIGPNYLGLRKREKEIIQALYTLIPEKYRYFFNSDGSGKLLVQPMFYDPKHVAASDPSEAACSEEIVASIEKYFNVIEFNKAGGTVLHTLLNGIAGHFREDDPDSVAVLNLLMAAEETLIKVGEIESHFAVIVAQPK